MIKDKRFPEFIGREEILNNIDKFLKSLNSESGIYILHGDGGIGKTTLMLRLRENLKSNNEFLLSRIIDFTQIVNRTKISTMNNISKISEPHFSDYQEALKEFHKFEKETQTEQPGQRMKYHKKLESAFLKDFKTITSNGMKTILFFDTCELIYFTSLIDLILKIVSDIPNVLIFLSGRPPETPNSDTINQFFTKKIIDCKIKQSNCQIIQLEGFNEVETNQYFNQAKDGKNVDEELRKKIHLLTQGNPIRIALSIEWLKRGVEFSDIFEYTMKEWQTSKSS